VTEADPPPSVLAAKPAADLRHAAVGGAMWSMCQLWVGRVAQFVTFLVLARLLEPAQFGLVALASFFVGLVGVVVDLGLTSYLVQRERLGPRTLETAFWLSLVIGAALTALVLGLAPFVASAYHQQQLTGILRALACTFVLTALTSTQVAILQRQLMFRALALRSLIGTLVAAAAAVALAYSGAGVWSLVAQALIAPLVGVVVLWRASGWRPRFAFDRGESRDMLSFGTNVLGMEVMGYFRSRGGDLVVGSILGADALGILTIANRLLSSVLDLSTAAILVVAGPIFAKVKRDRAQLTRAYQLAMSYSVAMTAPVLIVLGIVSPVLVPRLFGAQWVVSGQLARILCLGAITASLTYFDRSLLLMVNRARAELGVTAASMVSHLAVLAATAPFGLHFMVVALAVRNLLFWPFRLLIARRYAGISIRPVLGPVTRVLAASVLAGPMPVLVYLAMSGQPALVVSAACAAVMVPSYGLAVYLVARPTYRDFAMTARAMVARLRMRRPESAARPAPVVTGSPQPPSVA
jgi:O-antigen/teichoic acid export membrane protein